MLGKEKHKKSELWLGCVGFNLDFRLMVLDI